MQLEDISPDLRRILIAILQLMKQSQNGWVHWNQVARLLTGTAHAASTLSSFVELYSSLGLVATSRNVVKLTAIGLELIAQFGDKRESITAIIADSVVSYARGLRPIVLDIQSLSIMATVGNKFVHAVNVELNDEVLPTETPVEIACRNSNRIHGKLVGQEHDGGILYIACDTDILPAAMPSKVIIDRAYLLSNLAEQLRMLDDLPERYASILEPSQASIIADGNSIGVAERLADLPTPWTRFLWGPPGAGKTFGLGHLTTRLLKANPQENVLIIAPSNRAVDVATSHVRTRLAANSLEHLINDRRVLRFGYPRSPDVLEVPELLGPANLDELNRRVEAISRQIKQIEKKSKHDRDLAVLRAELLAAQEAVKDAVRDHVDHCSVVVTTTTLAYMPNSPVAGRRWDTVIIDEVTMAPPALCAFLASKSKKRLLLAGDPCQLGPVYEEHPRADENSKIWLKSDVFTVGGVSNGRLTPDAVKTTDSRLARITAQRRCGKDIWDRVQHLYPEVSNASNADRVRNLAALSPAPGSSVVLVDLSKNHARCEKMRGSWQNAESAQIALQTAGAIASQAPSNYRIGIICPYRAQVRMLRRWIREQQMNVQAVFNKCTVEAGTVHQFQGSEADAVIFDLVDGPGRRNLGLLMRGDAGTRLVNVAISRARGKLVVIANREWCRTACVAVHNQLLADLIFSHVTVVTPGVTAGWSESDSPRSTHLSQHRRRNMPHSP